MACRHALAAIPTAIAGPSRLPRIIHSSFPKTPLAPARRFAPTCSRRHLEFTRRWTSSSTSGSAQEDEPKQAKGQAERKSPVEGISEGGLPIPVNVATSTTSFSGTGSTAEDNKSLRGTSDSIVESPRQSFAGGDSTALPNYPALPSTSTSSSSQNLANPTKPLASSTFTIAPSGETSTNASFRLPNNVSIPPEVRERLSEWSNNVLQHSKRVAKDAEKRLVELGLKVNQMTGYQEVERLKALVFQKEDNLQKLRESARSAKSAFDEAVSSRSDAQRDVNSLLERKHSWSDSDVLKFTQLVRQDHSSSHLVGSTSVELKEAELKVDKAFNELMQTILQRYHEEQVWSDKIRSVSTWANLMGLALNAVIFLGAIIIVEPWKRKRLVSKLEERISEMMSNVDESLKSLESNLKGTASTTTATVGDLGMINGAKESITAELASTMDDLAKDRGSGDLEDPSIPIDLPEKAKSEEADGRGTIPVILNPMIRTNIEGLPPYLDAMTRPSQERDLAIAGMAGAVVMGILMTAGKWVFS
ncbi:uncharacterized protein I303_106066 [Kwoniella dejecticola CBS 10117]|uniref:Sensitive to high expression protein 9, mitochondrial n=1 Tax=Kwoniella dejecticola CBS 10117 TaxID=1296121 RepID=A0A1A6A165_9TREE|nr:uncharacterized protein I303_06086 [Kwoniella dejecticola CBS 10117]OBR83803.1 hypothetical protein I303_06086 [Kwoniella dejecticola CBS 10117]